MYTIRSSKHNLGYTLCVSNLTRPKGFRTSLNVGRRDCRVENRGLFGSKSQNLPTLYKSTASILTTSQYSEQQRAKFADKIK